MLLFRIQRMAFSSFRNRLFGAFRKDQPAQSGLTIVDTEAPVSTQRNPAESNPS